MYTAGDCIYLWAAHNHVQYGPGRSGGEESAHRLRHWIKNKAREVKEMQLFGRIFFRVDSSGCITFDLTFASVLEVGTREPKVAIPYIHVSVIFHGCIWSSK